MKKVFLFLSVIFCHTISAQFNPDKGLVACYSFEGNANDISGNGNHVIYNNAQPATDRKGKINGAYYFNGKDRFMMIKSNSQLSPKEMTIVAVIKPMGFYEGLCYNNSIIDKGSWDGGPGVYSLRYTAGEYTAGNCYEPAYEHQNFVGASSQNDGVTSKDHYIMLDKWYCVAFTIDKNYSSLFLNGQLISSAIRNVPIGKSDENIFVGKKDNLQYPYWFKGVIDEIRIYNRALNAEEVKKLYSTVLFIEPHDNMIEVR